ncbi:MAG: Holliday junction branch migration DNA helicase RuvB [Gammaproteobacteria bacterium]|nr:Holliday junction branch migration DNA helicase RuvB [Gammaproteobacteria bacterium]
MNDALSARASADDLVLEKALRPKTFDEYVGQTRVVEQLKLYVDAAKGRSQPLDHLLISGPPGLGKTTLAQVIAGAFEVNIKITSGTLLERKGDLAGLLTNLKRGDIFFIDEVHRMNRPVEEFLYPAMEDFVMDFLQEEGPGARSVRLPLPPMTVIGATTRPGMLSAPLRDRFGIDVHLTFYTPDELAEIVTRSAERLGIPTEAAGALEVAKRSRGTPRIANRLLRRVRDFAEVRHQGAISQSIADEALDWLDVDRAGLDWRDRHLMQEIIEKYDGGPAGLTAMAAASSLEQDTITDVIEPFLVQEGYLLRTPRGRVVSKKAYDHLELKAPEGAQSNQGNLDLSE